MTSDLILDVESISKKYCRTTNQSTRYGMIDIINSFLGRPVFQELRADEFWSVDNVSFSLKRGDCLGIVGRNGAGKSTLLKLVSKIISPDSGKLEISGRVCSLLEVSSGFHPGLTGKENIYIKGQILGLSKSEIEKKMTDIIEFSGIAEFIDTPVKGYSTGMLSRLGFSIAAHIDCDLLILDEILAVGDQNFKVKCMRYLDSIKPTTAIMFVSHNMGLVSRICNLGLYIENGRAKAFGKVDDVINQYEKTTSESVSQKLSLTSFVKDINLYVKDSLNHKDLFQVDVSIEMTKKIHYHISVNFVNKNNIICLSVFSPILYSELSRNSIRLKINSLLLNTGTYHLNINIWDKSKAGLLASFGNATKVNITGSYEYLGIYNQDAEWDCL